MHQLPSIDKALPLHAGHIPSLPRTLTEAGAAPCHSQPGARPRQDRRRNTSEQPCYATTARGRRWRAKPSPSFGGVCSRRRDAHRAFG